MHKLLNISDFESLLGHPVVGASWEGFVAENIIVTLSNKWRYSYYRKTGQTEIDLVLEGRDKKIWAIEIKKSSAPNLKKGFHMTCEDIGATRKFMVYSGSERFPIAGNTEAIGLTGFLKMLEEVSDLVQ